MQKKRKKENGRVLQKQKANAKEEEEARAMVWVPRNEIRPSGVRGKAKQVTDGNLASATRLRTLSILAREEKTNTVSANQQLLQAECGTTSSIQRLKCNWRHCCRKDKSSHWWGKIIIT